MSSESVVQLARVLPGAQLIDTKSVNSVYRGQVLLADGSMSQAYIKDLNNWELASETMAAAVCVQLGLPTPRPFLAISDNDTLTLTKAPTNPDNFRITFASVDADCPHVAFRYEAAPNQEKEEVIRKFAEQADLPGLYYFDNWLANIDRHAANLLFGDLGQVWLIDHGLCFGGPAWPSSNLNPQEIYKDRLSEWLTPRLLEGEKKSVEVQGSKLVDKLKNIDLSQTATKNYVDQIVDQEHVNQIVTFLTQRITEVTRVVTKSLFPEQIL